MNKRLNIKVVLTFLMILFIFERSHVISYAKFNMSYLYGNYDYISLVERTNGTLNEVSPSYFDLNIDGTLKLNTVDVYLVNTMHEKGLTVTPFLSNHWDRAKGRNALKNREKLANQIVEAINKYNLDGINVDLENLTEADRNDYTDLVRLLKEKLPSSKSVSVAVAANPYSWNTGWQGSYDYKALADYSDYIMLMTYDEHYEGGPAGPVASIGFVENSIKYALEHVPNDKIVLGIPFFGRYWKDGDSNGGYGVTNTKIENMINQYTSVVTYDNATESVKAVITIKNGEKTPIINGRTLTAGTYTFWYENEQSISKKLELVNKYNLKGSGSWSLGQETADTWNYYKDIVNPDEDANMNGFIDVKSDYWAKEAINYAKDMKWIEGKEKNKFEPELSLTRAEFATIICRVLGYNEGADEIIYKDTENHWAKGSINILSRAGIVNGYGNGIFKPDGCITREEAAKILYYLTADTKEMNVNATYFNDVSIDRWSYAFIQKLSGLGVINGYGNGEFKPANAIKRSEIVMILYRIFA